MPKQSDSHPWNKYGWCYKQRKKELEALEKIAGFGFYPRSDKDEQKKEEKEAKMPKPKQF